jgi:hypothetical protein
MRERLRASFVIAKRQVQEGLLSPGLYVTLALGLVLGWFLVRSFASSIDSSGFNPTLNPVSDVCARLFAGAFGVAFVGKLFAEGPFLLALVVSFLPVFLYLCISLVFRFGQERSAGAVELLSYGPADGTSYLAAAFITNAAFAALALVVVTGFLALTAALGGMATGRMFLLSAPLLFFLCLSVFSFGILCSVLGMHPSSALAFFLGIMVTFFLVLAGAYSTTDVRTVSSVAAAVLQWFSPLYYLSLSLQAAQGGHAAGFLAGAALLVVLAAVLLVLSHFAMRRRGVRA